LLSCGFAAAQEGTVLDTPIDVEQVRDAQRITFKSGCIASTSPTLERVRAWIGPANLSDLKYPSDVTGAISGNLPVFAAPDQNYIKTTTYLEAYDSDSSTCTRDKLAVDYRYFDGLGRPLEDVSVYASPDGYDVVSPYEYDDFGRQSTEHLPYTGDNSNGAFVAVATATGQKANYYSATLCLGSDGAYAFRKKKFEPSPLNRVSEQGAPGASWQPGGNTVKYEYQTNSEALSTYRATNAIGALESLTYPAGSLYVVQVTDENGSQNGTVTREYKDVEGRVVLKEVSNPSSPGGKDQTYYLYDDFGLLRCVVPPGATATTSGKPDYTTNRCYWYRYDSRKRMTAKMLPGADWVEMVYDMRDRLVLTRDGKLRDENRYQYTEYDDLNRPVIIGFYSSTNSPGYFATILESNANFIENIPDSEKMPQKYITYDMRNYPSPVYPGYGFYNEAGVVGSDKLSVNNKGRVSATKIRIPGTNEFLITSYFYDKYGRVLQTVSDDNLGYKTITSNRYDFTGRLTRTRHRTQVAYPYCFDQIYTYDHRGRLRTTSISISGGSETVVSANTYNGIGQLVKKYLHSAKDNQGTHNPFLQQADYAYNIRGWLTGINGGYNDQAEGDLYSEELCYDKPWVDPDTKGQYNGNISALRWRCGANSNLYYYYSYDRKNQLLEADFKWSKFVEDGNQYDELFSYLQNGDLETILRYGKDGQKIDDITLTCTNHLDQAVDAAPDRPNLPDFKSGTSDYTYDRNGNMVKETGREFTIAYNHLNLPVQVTGSYNGTATNIFYTYTFDGMKLRRRTVDGDVETLTDYVGPFVFETINGQRRLSYILMPEGRLYNTAAYDQNPVWEWQYFLKDHLGNVRLVIRGDDPRTAIVCQENHYYSFGMRMADLGSEHDNPYLYNGKEFQPDLELNWYDYGARYYDASLGRWHSVDPIAESYYDFSSYHFTANNPMIFIDTDGMGYYYASDGTFLGDDRIDDDFIYNTTSKVIQANTDKDGNINWIGVGETEGTESIGCFEEFVNMNGYEISSTELKQNLVGLSINMKSDGITEEYKQIQVVSGDRSVARNKKAGGSDGSTHIQGLAADIKVNGMSNETLSKAAASYGTFGCVIFYPNIGDTEGFGTHMQTVSITKSNTLDILGKFEPYTQTTEVQNSQNLKPHTHVDMRSSPYLGRYAGYNGKKNVYKPWISKTKIR